jgi:hypothetical protein
VTSARHLLAGLTLATATVAGSLAPATTASAGYADASISTAVVTVPMVFPVLGQTSYVDTFLACRSGCTRKHFGQDLMGPKMRPLVAAFNGVVSSVKYESYVGEGNYVTVRGDNGWSANYLHVNNDTPGTDDGKGTAQWAFAPGIREGKRVFAGELLGWSGDSGNAESTGPHLHFELRKGDSWGGVVYNAFSSLNHASHIAAPRTSGSHPEGSYVKSCATCPVYEIVGGLKHLMRPEVMAERSVTSAMAVVVTANELGWYRTGYPSQLPGARAYRAEDGVVWFVYRGRRYQMAPGGLAAVFVAGTRVRTTTAAALATVPVATETSPPLPTLRGYEGALLKASGTTDYFYVTGGVRRLAPDTATLVSWGLRRLDAVVFTETQALDPAFPRLGEPLPMHDGVVVQDSALKTYVVSRGARRPMGSPQVYRMYGWGTVPVLHPGDETLSRLPVTSALP